MKFIIKDNYEEMSRDACRIVIEVIKNKPNALICFPTGSTPIRMYELLVEANQKGEVDFSQVRVRSVDEYVGLPASHHQSYAYFLNHHLLSKVNLNPKNVILLETRKDDLEKVCWKYQELIEEDGGIDLYIDGVGENGHLGFNEPADEMILDYHVQELAEETRQVNARFFNSIDEVPKRAISIGINDILNARLSLFLSSGTKKAKAWQRFFKNAVVTSQFPLSFLHLSNNSVAIMDLESAMYIEKSLKKIHN